MKILCIADQIDPLVYTASIKERFADIDLVLSAGDLPMEYLDFIVSSLNKPLLFVFGNHNLEDLGQYQKDYSIVGQQAFRMDMFRGSGATYTGFRVTREGKLLVAGLGGCMRYNRGNNQFTDSQMYLKIFALIPRLIFNRIFHGRFVDILLTHAAPRGIHDLDDPCHRGFKAFLWFVRVFKPEYLVHGHVHLYDLNTVRDSRLGRTRIINAFGHYVIELEDRL
ncbi:MAG: metallophosphoesterase [Spirochaetaceae bacterium]|jgi:Icc-related predicted phosphoesterase|nr:metallophosphoesterase [Spirochaetaceae bacterium]